MSSTPSKALSPHRGRQSLAPTAVALSPVRSGLPPLTPSRAKLHSRGKTPQKAEIVRKTPKKGDNEKSALSAEEGIQGKPPITPNKVKTNNMLGLAPFHSYQPVNTALLIP